MYGKVAGCIATCRAVAQSCIAQWQLRSLSSSLSVSCSFGHYFPNARIYPSSQRLSDLICHWSQLNTVESSKHEPDKMQPDSDLRKFTI